MHIHKKKHKLVGEQIQYWNGEKWLVRETLNNKEEAEAKFKELKEKKHLKE